MAIRNIRTLGDDILRAKAKEITEMTPRIEELIDDMFDTMYEANGVGLAAPQVGIRKNVTLGSLESEDVAPSLRRDSSVNCPERFPVSSAHLPADGHLGGRNLKRPLD